MNTWKIKNQRSMWINSEKLLGERMSFLSMDIYVSYGKYNKMAICWTTRFLFSSVQSLSRVWLCHPMNRSMPGLPVHHQLLESTQTHVHRVGDAIQPFHPLSFPSPPAFNLSQHQGLFQWVSASHQVAKVLEFQLQRQSFQWIFRTDFFRIDWFDFLVVQGTLKSLQQSQFKIFSSSALNFLYGPTLISVHDCLENHSLD